MLLKTLENYNRQNSQQQFIESTDRPSLHTDSDWNELG